MPKSNKKLKFIKKISPRRSTDSNDQENNSNDDFGPTMQIKRAKVEWRTAQ